MDLDTKRKGVLRVILQAQQTVCHKDQPLQHLHCKLEDHHRLPQSTIRTKDHQDPPECNGTSNGSTRAPADSKGPGTAKGKNKVAEPCPGVPSGTGSAIQPAESSKNTILCSACWQKWPLEQKLPLLQFL